MGTRADFYVGRGPKAEWIGSVAYDGFPFLTKAAVGNHEGILTAETESGFRNAVTKMLRSREDATLPAQGWPWPWEDSGTTDYAYAFDDGEVWVSAFGCKWFKIREGEPQDASDDEKVTDFPNMKDRQKVTLGPRSGILVLKGSG